MNALAAAALPLIGCHANWVAPNPPRDHHRVPQWYLRRFANGSRKTLVVTRDGSQTLTAVKRASVVRDFYAFEDVDGQLDQSLEVAIGPIETAGAAVVRSMLAGSFPPSRADRLELAGFLALQVVRGEMLRRAWQALVADEGAALSRNMTLQTTIADLPQLTNILLRMRWRMCHSEGPVFFTGDQPVQYWRRGQSPRFFTGMGPMSAQEVRVVLDPQNVLILTWEGTSRAERSFALTPAVARRLNVFTSRWCEHELYCRPDLAHHLPTSPVEPLPSSVDPKEADAVVALLSQLPNWRQAAALAESTGWGDPAEGYGPDHGRHPRYD